ERLTARETDVVQRPVSLRSEASAPRAVLTAGTKIGRVENGPGVGSGSAMPVARRRYTVSPAIQAPPIQYSAPAVAISERIAGTVSPAMSQTSDRCSSGPMPGPVGPTACEYWNERP